MQARPSSRSRDRRRWAGIAIGLLVAVLGALALLTHQGDERSAPPYKAAPNLITNGSFERGVRGWTSCGGSLSSVADPRAPSGAKAIEVVRSGPDCGGASLNPAQPPLNGSSVAGQALIGSAFARAAHGPSGGVAVLTIRERAPSGRIVAMARSEPQRLSGRYTELQRSYVTHGDGDDVEAYVSSRGGTGGYRVDDVRLSALDDEAACPLDVADFGAGAWPPACWRPYSPGSAFNEAVPEGAKSAPDSAATVEQFVGNGVGGGPNPLVVGSPRTDANIPDYYASESDPEFELRCLGRDQGGGPAPCNDGIDGRRIHIPDAAEPSGGTAQPATGEGPNPDAHMTVIQPDGTEYDLYDVTRKDRGGGVVEFAGGGAGSVSGDGTGFGAIASQTGTLGGLLRAPELRAGIVNHALQMYVPCVSGDPVAPASGNGLDCATGLREPKRYPGLRGYDACAAPRMGDRLQLQLSDEDLSKLEIPEYELAVLRAFARYGAYVVDTSGSRFAWGVRVEGAGTYTSFGRPDPAALLARQLHARRIKPEVDGARSEYQLPLDGGVDWRNLRVVDASGRGNPQC